MLVHLVYHSILVKILIIVQILIIIVRGIILFSLLNNIILFQFMGHRSKRFYRRYYNYFLVFFIARLFILLGIIHTLLQLYIISFLIPIEIFGRDRIFTHVITFLPIIIILVFFLFIPCYTFRGCSFYKIKIKKLI